MRNICIALIVGLLCGLFTGCAPQSEPIPKTLSEGIVHTISPIGTDTPMEAVGFSVGVGSDEKTEKMLWCFEVAEDGYYRIRNDATGDSAPSCTELILDEACDERGFWRIFEVENGASKIIGKLQYERVSGIPMYLNVSDGEVMQDGEGALWEIKELTLHLNVFYDPAFASMYEEKGIYAVDALEKILFENTTADESFRSVTGFFSAVLHIRLVVNIVDTPYESYPYTAGCLYRDDPDTPCHNCFDKEIDGYGKLEYCKSGYHHKDADHIIQSTPQSDTAFNVIFTGHSATCACDPTREGDEVHTDDKSGIYGRAEGIGVGNRVAVFLGSFGDAEEYDRIKFTVAHEVTHLLGGQHHVMTEQCIHGFIGLTDAPSWDFTEAHLSLPMCDTCIARIDSCKLAALYRHEP